MNQLKSTFHRNVPTIHQSYNGGSVIPLPPIYAPTINQLLPGAGRMFKALYDRSEVPLVGAWGVFARNVWKNLKDVVLRCVCV